MKRIAWIGVVAAVLALGLAGCEWETGSGADSWTSAYDWVNFSGVYRGTTTTVLDPDYTPGATNEVPEVDTATMFRYQTRQSGQTSGTGKSSGGILPSVSEPRPSRASAGLRRPSLQGPSANSRRTGP